MLLLRQVAGFKRSVCRLFGLPLRSTNERFEHPLLLDGSDRNIGLTRSNAKMVDMLLTSLREWMTTAQVWLRHWHP